ncbi:MAG: riboflavin biosynthesis protein RibF [Anaerolineales bacterium]
MFHYHSLDNLNLQNTWLTIGIFDGVHRGHQEILHQLVSGAHTAGEPAAVLTFSPHPAVVLGGKTDFKYLTTPEERLELLGLFGVDVVITQTFDRLLADQTAAAFMRRLSQTLDLRHLVIGYDTALGRGREADATRLTEIGKELGYSVQVVPALTDTAGVISSTRIRRAILAGNISAAASDLGHPFAITGPVIHGDGRGHTINIPTANIQIPGEKVLPAYGIYACRAWVNGQLHLAATSLGVRPTFYGDPPAPTIEAHLLDFHQNLYGQMVKLEFMEYLRPEEKYDSVNALVEQIQKDIAQTRKILELRNQ